MFISKNEAKELNILIFKCYNSQKLIEKLRLCKNYCDIEIIIKILVERGINKDNLIFL